MQFNNPEPLTHTQHVRNIGIRNAMKIMQVKNSQAHEC
jgi:hypothetical protein